MNKNIVFMITLSILCVFLSVNIYAAGDATAGKNKATTCAGCHGANGEGMLPNTKIAGMNVGNFKKAIQDYKTGERKHTMMEMFAKQLSEADVADLAAYYSTK